MTPREWPLGEARSALRFRVTSGDGCLGARFLEQFGGSQTDARAAASNHCNLFRLELSGLCPFVLVYLRTWCWLN
jgi:hypothetical protein